MEYDTAKIQRVKLSDLVFNDWNPKEDDKSYKKVKHSIELNGLIGLILVREVEDGLEIVDGNSRARACKELGFEYVYVYNLGNIDEAEAKSLALWFQVQVPFDSVELAPLVVELDSMGMTLPYDNKEIEDFRELESFDMSSAFEDEEPVPEEEKERMEIIKYRLGPEVANRLGEIILCVEDEENVNEGRALELLLESWFSV